MRPPREVPQDGGIVGFVGREWQRKGLPLAVDIVGELRRTRPNLRMWVVGPGEEEVTPLFRDWTDSYRLLGWRTDNAHFEQIDVLLHPAKAEPYGMVISEAMAARVPVVVSDRCGAAEQVDAAAGRVVGLDAPLREWTDALASQLERKEAPPGFVHGWQEVAQAFVVIYTALAMRKHNDPGA
jgi:UDP-glucose:(heptosyl)LPS alpha-1,3-glucosyltransferase